MDDLIKDILERLLHIENRLAALEARRSRPDTRAPSSSTIEARREAFVESIRPFLETYGRDMCNDFYLYWSEPNKSQTRMRFEMEKTWDVALRLSNWSKHNEK